MHGSIYASASMAAIGALLGKDRPLIETRPRRPRSALHEPGRLGAIQQAKLAPTLDRSSSQSRAEVRLEHKEEKDHHPDLAARTSTEPGPPRRARSPLRTAA